MAMKMCELCLEKGQITFDLFSNTSLDKEKKTVIEKHLSSTVMVSDRSLLWSQQRVTGDYSQFSTDNIDCICSECWRKVKDFDDFCNNIENVHQMQAFCSANEPFGSDCDDDKSQCVMDEREDTKPTLQQLQTAITKQHNFRNNEQLVEIPTTDIKHEFPNVSICNKTDDDDAYFDDFDANYITTDSEDNFPSHSWIVASDTTKSQIKIEVDRPTGKCKTRAMCEICGRTFSSTSHFNVHYEGLHQNNSYYCDICGLRCN